MPRVFSYFLIDEKELPSQRAGSDREAFDQLVAAVDEYGAIWADVEAQELAFMEVLERIDREALIGNRFLPVFTYNNSPHKLLGPAPDAPPFGYFNPEQARDLDAALRSVPPEVTAAFAADPLLHRVFAVVRDTAREAANRGEAIAVLHRG
jgi:hypothetical protein